MSTPRTNPPKPGAIERAVLREYDEQRARKHAALIMRAEAQARVELADLRVTVADEAMRQLDSAGFDPGENPYAEPTERDAVRYLRSGTPISEDERRALGWPL